MKRVLSILMSIAMLFSIIAAVDLSAYAATTKTVSGTFNYAYATQVVDLVNKERAANGLKALTMTEDLTATAMIRAAEITVNFSHTRPNGESCFTAFNWKIHGGENIAAYQPTPEQAVKSWMLSESHKENILMSDYQTIGVGCFEYNGKYYWVQNFSAGTGTSYNLSAAVPATVEVGTASGVQSKIISLGTNTATLSTTATYYNGSVKTPKVTAKDSNGKELKEGTDYEVEYDKGRINVGRYFVKVNYKGDYSGSQTLYFNIMPKKVENVKNLLAKANGFTVYWDPQPENTTGYQIQYSTSSSFTNPTTITMPKATYSAKAITGLAKNKKYYVRIRTYKTTKFEGANYNIYSYWSTVSNVSTVTTTAKLNTTATYYNGSVKTPTVTVTDSTGKTLKKGTDYTVTMDSGRKAVGRYGVKITYKGNYQYCPAQTVYFNIIPKNVTGVKKVTAGKKCFTVSWNTQKTQTTGYQIQYSTSSNFANAKTITMPKSSYSAKKITGLTGGKKYYVRIRTYKTVKFNGANYNIYSYWCAAKSVTTKK